MNVVGKCKEIFVVAVIILQSNFNRDCVLVILCGKINNIGMNNGKRSLFVNIIDKALYTALVNKVVFYNFVFVSLISKLNMHACVKKSLLTQTLFKHTVLINIGFLEDERICLKAYFRTLYV